MEAEHVLEFWFGPKGATPSADPRWWKKDPAFDATIRERFAALHGRIANGELDGWRSDPRTCLAYVIVLDQFSRNMYRDAKEAFAFDAMAQAATLAGIAGGLDRALGFFERSFFYMPLVHAEDRAVQDDAIIAFARLVGETPEAARGDIVTYLIYAVRHRDIVHRFGRFPHRNAILGRRSSPEELAFLKEPGSSF